MAIRVVIRRVIGIVAGLAPVVLALAAFFIEKRPIYGIHNMIGRIIFGLGAFISLSNLYFSFLRYPLVILLGGEKENYRSTSGIPIFGNLAVLVGLWLCSPSVWLNAGAIVAIAIDTGGLPWFIACVWKDKSFWDGTAF